RSRCRRARRARSRAPGARCGRPRRRGSGPRPRRRDRRAARAPPRRSAWRYGAGRRAPAAGRRGGGRSWGWTARRFPCASRGMSCRPSPLQNRVAPDGSLNAVAARGTLMGNRGGRLHRADGTLGRARWRSRAWIACLTEFRGRHRAVWGESYSEIFFLDEATALAAGHRPCFECRRAEALAFAAAWGEPAPRAGEMDAVLHAERLGPRQRVAFGALPAGAIFAAAEGFHL